MLKRDFTKTEIYLFVIVSLGIIIPINFELKDYIGLWSLLIVPTVALLHKFPNWKTGIISLLSLIAIQINSEVYLMNSVLSNDFKKELFTNIIINSTLILNFTLFTVKNANIQVIDPLTKAFNRKFYNNFVNDKKYFKNLSIQMIDIDHFKKINDTYGHDAGDYVLSELVKVIKQGIRKTDKIVRLGGEEFTILSPNTTSEEGCMMAQRICKLVEHSKFVYEGQVIPVTVSIGLANQIEASEPTKLAKKADKALYMAKQNGRNQVACIA